MAFVPTVGCAQRAQQRLDGAALIHRAVRAGDELAVLAGGVVPGRVRGLLDLRGRALLEAHVAGVEIEIACEERTIPGYFLYFPSRAQRSTPLRLFIEMARELAVRAG